MLVAMQFTAIDPPGYHSMAIVLGVTISTGLVLVFKNVILVLHPLTWKYALSIDNCVKLLFVLSMPPFGGFFNEEDKKDEDSETSRQYYL